jgi:hypothetical protein
MARSTRERLMRAGLVLALLAGVVVITFGAGYRASNALLDGGSAYVQERHKVVRVNAESRDTDAETARKLASGTQRLEVVQVAPGVVYVVNNDTGVVWRLPTDTMKPEPVAGAPGAARKGAEDAKPQVVAGGGRAYLFDKNRGAITLLEGPSGRGRQEITLPKPAAEVVVDRSGTAWALSPQVGELYGIAGGRVVARHRVAGAWEPARLTLAGERPVVYLPVRGAATMFDRTGQKRTVNLPKEASAAGVEVAAPGADARVLVITSQRTGELIKVDFTDSDVRRTQLAGRAGHYFLPPVVSHGRVYVADTTDRHVVILDLDSLRQVYWRTVPGTRYFKLFARDGRVWINDPYHNEMLSFDRDGRSTSIDKNRGDDLGERPTGRPEVPGPEAPGPDEERRPPIEQLPLRPPPDRRPGTAPAEVRVPDVVGMAQDRARDAIEDRRLRFRPVSRPGDCATGEVLSTDPRAGSRVRIGTPVAVVVCGPTQVPNLAGMHIDQAHQALQAARLRWQDEAGGAVQTPADIGKVVSQDPPAGTPLGTSGVVKVGYVDPNRGSPIVVPNLVGASNEQACATLQSIQLACAGAPAPHATATGVHTQNPGPPAQVPAGTPVSYAYQPIAAVALNRYKADRVESRFLSLGAGPQGDGQWNVQPQMARVYPPEAVGQVPGLIPIYPAKCGGCDVQTLYFYSRNGGVPNKPDNAKWTAIGQPAFGCFEIGSAPAGTVPLRRVFADFAQGRRWAFAPVPSGEFDHHKEKGYQADRDLCFVWPRG